MSKIVAASRRYASGFGLFFNRLLQNSAEVENEDIWARKSGKKRRIFNICNVFSRFSIA
jgi:hypothetical protein